MQFYWIWTVVEKKSFILCSDITDKQRCLQFLFVSHRSTHSRTPTRTHLFLHTRTKLKHIHTVPLSTLYYQAPVNCFALFRVFSFKCVTTKTFESHSPIKHILQHKKLYQCQLSLEATLAQQLRTRFRMI